MVILYVLGFIDYMVWLEVQMELSIGAKELWRVELGKLGNMGLEDFGL